MVANNIDDIPRTLESINSLPDSVKYRIALQSGALPSDKESIKGFVAKTKVEQSTIILQKLLENDAARAAGGGQAQPLPPAQMTRQPEPIQQQQQLPYAQQPGTPQQLGGPPVQMPPTQVQAAPQPLQRTPQGATGAGAPPVIATAQAAAAASSLMAITAQLKELKETIDTEVPGLEEIEAIKTDLQASIMGVATSVNILVIIGILMLEKSYELPRELIYEMLREEIGLRTSEQMLLAMMGPAQGKY